MNQDLVWAMEWLDTLTDAMHSQGMAQEFLADLAKRRLESRELDNVAREVNL